MFLPHSILALDAPHTQICPLLEALTPIEAGTRTLAARDVYKRQVLNDNEMPISHNVGALSLFLSRNMERGWARRVRREVKDWLCLLYTSRCV